MFDTRKLAEYFPAEDIEWRVGRSGTTRNGIYCIVMAYITARAIQNRLDDVCGPDNWRNEEPRIITLNSKSYFAGGISIRIGDEWITKWDVCEPTRSPNIDPAKGGFSGAMKRAGAQWGIGRYLYYLSDDAFFAEVSDTDPKTRGWRRDTLSEKYGGTEFWWKPPSLPGWALPKPPEYEINEKELNDLKLSWRDRFMPDTKNPEALREGFAQFVTKYAGEFPHSDYTCWTRDTYETCLANCLASVEVGGVDSDIPFE